MYNRYEMWNWGIISCPSTVALQLCETFQLPAVCRVARVSQTSDLLFNISAEQKGCWLSDSVGKLSRSRKIHRKADQTALLCPSCCQDAVVLASEAARMWKQQITINMKLFFTLYILSIFTHKMYMIGMHIIFLLTDSFNKALCQSAVVSSLFCSYTFLVTRVSRSGKINSKYDTVLKGESAWRSLV